MKKGFIAVGKAAMYFGVYLLTQVLVSVVYSTVLTTQMTMEIMAAGEELDVVTMTEMVAELMMGRLMEMTFVAGIVTLFIFWLVFLVRKKKFTREVAIHKIPLRGILPISIMAVCFNIITTVLISIVPL